MTGSKKLSFLEEKWGEDLAELPIKERLRTIQKQTDSKTPKKK